MKRLVVSLCDAVTSLAKFIMGCSVAAIVLITMAAVWWRYVLDSPLSWVEQVSNMIFIWIVFLGSAVLYRQNLHIGVDVVLAMLSKKTRAIWKWGLEILNMVFIGVLFVYSLILTIDVFPTTAGALDMSPAWYYMSAPISCVMMMLYFVEKIVDPARREPEGAAGEF